MSYEAQLREKQTQVDKVFATAENSTVVHPIILHPIIAAAPPDRQQHRNRVDYAFSARQ
jgi:tRNA/tmRNA/rRNA uracil-C5-methylase (TrmA/RlmC/RlmD family)